MEITNDTELAERIGGKIRHSLLTEDRQIYMAEETNLPAVVKGRQIYVQKNQLVYRMNKLLFQESSAITGAGKAFAACEQELALHIRSGIS